MTDGWIPPAYPKEEELIALEDKINSYRKAVLAKRHVCVKDPQFVKLSAAEQLEKGEYSLVCLALMEGPYSGPGDDKTWYLIVYYEPSKRMKAERAFKAAGIDLVEYEQVPVDPDSEIDEEQSLMVLHGMGTKSCIVNSHEYQVAEGADAEDPWGPEHPDGPHWE